MNRCGSFPLPSAPHSLFSMWTNLKRSEKIPEAPRRRWGEWIWLTGPSGLHRNSPQGLNISCIRVFDQIRDPEIPITLRPLLLYIPIKISIEKPSVRDRHVDRDLLFGHPWSRCTMIHRDRWQCREIGPIYSINVSANSMELGRKGVFSYTL